MSMPVLSLSRWEVCVRCGDGTLAVIAKTLTKPRLCRFLVKTPFIKIEPDDLLVRKISKGWAPW